MSIIELDEDNVNEYIPYMGEDMAENIQREFYRGIIIPSGEGDGISAGMVWQYRNFEDEKDTESVIEWIRIIDSEAADTLLGAYHDKIKEEGAVRSHFVIPVKEYKNEKEALKAAGFSAKLSEGDNIIVELSELSAMPIMKDRRVPDNIGTISELTVRKFRKGISKTVQRGRKGLCEDLAYLSMSYFEADVSCYSMDDDEISGFLLFHKLPSDMLSVQLMVGLDDNYQKNLLGMIRKFIISMEEKYTPETLIVLNRHNSASLQLAEKLLPRGFGIPVYAGSREERCRYCHSQ